jgi:hypothetical protein
LIFLFCFDSLLFSQFARKHLLRFAPDANVTDLVGDEAAAAAAAAAADAPKPKAAQSYAADEDDDEDGDGDNAQMFD